jgi:hypothetical protein
MPASRALTTLEQTGNATQNISRTLVKGIIQVHPLLQTLPVSSAEPQPMHAAFARMHAAYVSRTEASQAYVSRTEAYVSRPGAYVSRTEASQAYVSRTEAYVSRSGAYVSRTEASQLACVCFAARRF